MYISPPFLTDCRAGLARLSSARSMVFAADRGMALASETKDLEVPLLCAAQYYGEILSPDEMDRRGATDLRREADLIWDGPDAGALPMQAYVRYPHWVNIIAIPSFA